MKTCQSRITKTYTRKKADSIYPTIPLYGTPNPAAEGLEICGGTISSSIYLSSGGCRCCGDGPEIDLNLSCSRCSYPYVNESLYSALSSYGNTDFVEKLIKEYLDE